MSDKQKIGDTIQITLPRKLTLTEKLKLNFKRLFRKKLTPEQEKQIESLVAKQLYQELQTFVVKQKAV